MRSFFRLWPIWMFVFFFVSFSSNCASPVPSEVTSELPNKEKKEELAAKESAPDKSIEATQKESVAEPSLEVKKEVLKEPIRELNHEVIFESMPDRLVPEIVKEIVRERLPEIAVPRPGFGVIRGACGVLDDEWKSSKPYFFQNSIDLGTGGFDKSKLTKGGQQIWTDGNLGGSSVHSEVFSYEVLARCELAVLLKSESKIKYTNTGGKKTDILVKIDGYKVGVSVTRAFQYPPGSTYTMKNATKLLKKKLGDLPLSAANATKQDAWSRSILHILAYNKQHADVVKKAYALLDAKLKGNSLLFVTTTDGKDDYIY